MADSIKNDLNFNQLETLKQRLKGFTAFTNEGNDRVFRFLDSVKGADKNGDQIISTDEFENYAQDQNILDFSGNKNKMVIDFLNEVFVQSQNYTNISSIPLSDENGNLMVENIALTSTNPRDLENPLETLKENNRLEIDKNTNEPKEYFFSFPDENNPSLLTQKGPFYADISLRSRGRYFSQDGTEHYIKADTQNNIILHKANNHSSSIFVERNNSQSFLIPSPSTDLQEAEKILRQQGLILEGILGTGFIEDNRIPTGYRYFKQSDGQVFENSGNIFGLLEKTGGYVSKTDGSIELIDLRGSTKKEVEAKIAELKNDSTVRSINIGFEVFRESDLEIASSEERGETRSALIFVNGQFKSAVSTPAMSKKDVLNVAKAKYPNGQITVLNGDGDFYSQFKVRGDNNFSSDFATGYKNANLLVRPMTEEEKTSAPAFLTERFNPEAYKKADQEDKADDALNPEKVVSKLGEKAKGLAQQFIASLTKTPPILATS